jgi:hypothetical protein
MMRRMKTTRCTDSLVYTKKGIEFILKYINTMNKFDEPIDWYYNTMLRNNLDFKLYWSIPHFFIQCSGQPNNPSTIQNDRI